MADQAQVGGVPIDQQLQWFGSEIGRGKKRLDQAVLRGQMQPETAELIRRNQKAIYQSLKRLKDLEGSDHPSNREQA